jgi:hypothetical protein
MSIERFGTVDIDGLWNLRKTKGGHRPRFRGFDERADVSLVCEQKYHAVVGTEYLASNPTEVPEVAETIRSCTRAASGIQSSQRPAPASTRDPFQALSPELLMMLLEILERRDIANLSKSSQTFSQLPRPFSNGFFEKRCLGSGSSTTSEVKKMSTGWPFTVGYTQLTVGIARMRRQELRAFVLTPSMGSPRSEV